MTNTDINSMDCLSYELPEAVKCLKYAGEYERETELIDAMLERDVTDSLRRRLELEKMLAADMKNDYHTAWGEALAFLRSRIRDFNEAELRALVADGRIDMRLRRGVPAFQNSYYHSLLINTPALTERLLDPDEKAGRMKKSSLYEENMRIMKERGSRSFRFRIRHTISPAPGYIRAGVRARVHIPLPLFTSEQKNFSLLSSSHEVKISEGPQKTAFIDAPMPADGSFSVEYTYENTAYYKSLRDEDAVCAAHAFDIGEQPPHIVFTPYLRALENELAGGEKNPLRAARAFYDYITKNVRYTFVREYFLLDNIPEYAALNLRGDCGVQALLFITLCRIHKIPAEWQSGMCVTPTHVGSHDWARFYVEPYGWLFCDPSYGGGAFRSGSEARRLHYFGNLDPFRMAANSAFEAPFDPPKKFMRADPYDNQSGEIEYDDMPLSYSQLCHKRELIEAVETVES